MMMAELPPAPTSVPDAPFLVWQGEAPLPETLRRPVVAIGNFDGVHRGHQAVFAATRRLAERLGRPAAALTFEPHPSQFFAPDRQLFRLTPADVKTRLMGRFGLDGAIVLPFDAMLATTTASAFVDELLVGRLGVSGVVVGHDFHFGKGREGSPAFLEARAAAHGVAVEILAPVASGDTPVSSTAIRGALANGDLDLAARLLGYRWFVRGAVKHGDKRGRDLGFPTANLALAPGCGLRHGIYAVRVSRAGTIHEGVASFGRRPTFDNGAPLLEVFLFDFSGDLYGEVLEIELVAYLRGEERFASVEALVAQMGRDAENARRILAADARGEHPRSMIAGSLKE